MVMKFAKGLCAYIGCDQWATVERYVEFEKPAVGMFEYVCDECAKV